MLFAFRCYKRRALVQSGPPSKQRKIEPFISYIGKGCGSGLLGKQSDDSRLREDIYRLILAEDAEVQLEALFAKAEGSERRKPRRKPPSSPLAL